MCKFRSHGTFPLFGLQSSHLNICYYHQDLHRRSLRPGSRPGFYGDRRALLLIGAWPLPRRPGIGHALKRHPFSGLVDSAGMLSIEPFSEDQGRSAVHPRGIPPISFLAPYGFSNPLTRTHVRLLGPCFKTGRMGSPQADARSTLVTRDPNTSPDHSIGRSDGRINQVAFLRDVRPACSSTHYLGRGEAITGQDHRSCRGTKCTSYERPGPRPYAHEIYRIQKHDRASMH
ncbi:hypothetical protein V6N13_019495 [Hibiscus sabdariffa]